MLKSIGTTYYMDLGAVLIYIFITEEGDPCKSSIANIDANIKIDGVCQYEKDCKNLLEIKEDKDKYCRKKTRLVCCHHEKLRISEKCMNS